MEKKVNALLVIDVQNDFLPGGALAVTNGDKIIPVVNKLLEQTDFFSYFFVSQDWHPKDHKSFAENHTNRKIGEAILLNGVPQILWPVHCVQNSPGAEISKELYFKQDYILIQKGMDKEVDSYSAFFDCAGLNKTPLDAELSKRGVTDVYIVGLALDFCVKYTVLDAVKLGYKTHVIKDGCKAIDISEKSLQLLFTEFEKCGVILKKE